jgi:DNA-binding LacI/PurR family transcriptional regulator
MSTLVKPTLIRVAEQANVTLSTAYHALSDSVPVDPAVRRHVLEVARQLGYRLNVTLKDVAHEAKVSVATVSYVLNNTATVSAATRKRVLDAVTRLNYRPNNSAQNLKMAQTRTIGYAWHNVQPNGQINAVLDRFIYGITGELEACNYRLLTFIESSDHISSYEELINTNRVDGFILSNTNENDLRVQRLIELGFPFVAFGRANPQWDFSYVDVDGRAGIHAATAHLLAQGHRRIAILAWPPGSQTGDVRLQGYLDAMRRVGIESRPAWIQRLQNGVDNAQRVTRELLALEATERPTALVCLTDLMAIGAMRGIEDAALRIGLDVAVTGFDDDPIAEYLRPSLTSLRQPVDMLASRVVAMLTAIIDKEPLDKKHVVIEPQLIVRETSQHAYEGTPQALSQRKLSRR